MRRTFPLAFFLFLLFLAACARQQGIDPAAVKAEFGNFAVAVVPAEDNLVAGSLLYKGWEIARNSPLRDVSPGQASANPALPECRHLKTELFTGGANCCFGYYLLATCTGVDFAGYLEPYAGSIGDLAAVPAAAVAAYPATDAAFLYYAPKDATGRELFSLSRPESPRPERFIVFDKGWRPDARGEFSAAYAAMAAAARQDKNIPQTARAITAAYYDLMAGENLKLVTRMLQRALPKENVRHAAVILTDIDNAIERFNPVVNLNLRTAL